MTREEAIQRFNGIINAMSISVAQSKFYPLKAELDELCGIAIEALKGGDAEMLNEDFRPKYMQQSRHDDGRMTREEAIADIKNNIKPVVGGKSLDMAIEALQAEPNKAVPPSLVDVYKWERDVALSQLEEYGIGFGEKKRDDLVEVVRCKDCKYNLGETRSGRSILCNYCSHGVLIERDKNWYCADGEREEE